MKELLKKMHRIGWTYDGYIYTSKEKIPQEIKDLVRPVYNYLSRWKFEGIFSEIELIKSFILSNNFNALYNSNLKYNLLAIIAHDITESSLLFDININPKYHTIKHIETSMLYHTLKRQLKVQENENTLKENLDALKNENTLPIPSKTQLNQILLKEYNPNDQKYPCTVTLISICLSAQEFAHKSLIKERIEFFEKYKGIIERHRQGKLTEEDKKLLKQPIITPTIQKIKNTPEDWE